MRSPRRGRSSAPQWLRSRGRQSLRRQRKLPGKSSRVVPQFPTESETEKATPPAGGNDGASPELAEGGGEIEDGCDAMVICSSTGLDDQCPEADMDSNTNPSAPLNAQHESPAPSNRTDASTEGGSMASGGTQHPGLVMEPETYSATEEQLEQEVRRIYAGLAMVEKKSVEFIRDFPDPKQTVTQAQWQAMIALQRTLLQEHHDFYLASLHPDTTPALKRSADRYTMPLRLWRYGIYDFLELLRRRLPETAEYMETFIYTAYSMLTLHLETVRRFESTWIECLGDLARYRMALEDQNLRERENWCGIAMYWYNQAEDRAPGLGRIQHSIALAIVSRPNIVQRLFYHTKSLMTVHIFPGARESIPSLVYSALSGGRPTYDLVTTAFVRAHGELFKQRLTNELIWSAKHFTSNLERYIGRMGAAFRLQGVYMMSCNFAALFEYNHPDAVLPAEFDQSTEFSKSQRYRPAPERWTPADRLAELTDDLRISTNLRLDMIRTFLPFQTFATALGQIGDKNVYPTIHVTLAFVWSLALNHDSIRHIELAVPWRSVVAFLNTMIRSDTKTSVIESEAFPASEERKHMPEDFCLRGQAWTRFYYPPDFFAQCPTEDDERWIEAPSLSVSRAYRCLWLGVRIATVCLETRREKCADFIVQSLDRLWI